VDIGINDPDNPKRREKKDSPLSVYGGDIADTFNRN
jgi:hypothetical protein